MTMPPTAVAAPTPPELRPDAPLAPLTTIRVGGPADWRADVGSFRAAVAALAWARDAGARVAVVGKGSNLLVADQGFRGLVLRLSGRLQSISVRGTEVWCGGGASLPRAVQRAAAAGLEGLEFGASIPGTAGGAVAMNAGAYRADLAGVLRWAVLCSAEGRRRVGPADLELGYRRSAVRPDEVVAAVSFALRPGDAGAIAGRLAEYRGHRRATQPQGARTFGSVFTNPASDSAGRLLEAAGCKGLAVGGARFSPVHANFIEARPGCRAADVLALMAEGRRRVRAAGGPVLEPEVRYLDPVGGVGRPPLPPLTSSP
jgi:UDP-N-acetylenolpyruvoylglucosamine reductase